MNKLLFSLKSWGLITGILLILVGCSTNPNRIAYSPEQPPISGERYMEMARSASGNLGLEYRLRAAECFINAERSEAAVQVFREMPLAEEHAFNDELRNKVLEARLALLKQDSPQALLLVKEMLTSVGASSTSALSFQASAHGKKIALLLPSKGPHAEAAKTIKEGFFAAYYNSQQQQAGSSVKVYDTNDGTAVEAAFNQAVADHVDMIVGPLTKPEVQTIAKLSSKIPVLSLNAIGTGKGSKSLYQFGLMPEDEIVAVVEHARRQGHHRAFVIAPQSEWGQRMTQTFTKAWNANGGQVAGSLALKNLDHEQQSAQIQAVMQTGKNIKRQDIDMVFLAASPELARQIKPLITHYASVKLPVYSTATVYSGAPTPKKDHDLDGIRFCDMPWVLNSNANAADSQAAVTKLSSNNASPRYFAFGMDAYHLALQLEDTRSLSTGIRGATGELHLQGQRIQRRLSSAKFVNGVPVAD